MAFRQFRPDALEPDSRQQGRQRAAKTLSTAWPKIAWPFAFIDELEDEDGEKGRHAS